MANSGAKHGPRATARMLACGSIAAVLHIAGWFGFAAPREPQFAPELLEPALLELDWSAPLEAVPNASRAPASAVAGDLPLGVRAHRAQGRRKYRARPALNGAAAEPNASTDSGSGGKEVAEAPSSAAANPAPARRARLRAAADVCRDLFPSLARSSRAEVTLQLEVGEDGAVLHQRVVSAHPARQGYGPAARLCSRRLHFEPALDRRGRAIASSAVVRLRFSR